MTLQVSRCEGVKGKTLSQAVHTVLDRRIQSVIPALKLQMLKQEK